MRGAFDVVESESFKVAEDSVHYRVTKQDELRGKLQGLPGLRIYEEKR